MASKSTDILKRINTLEQKMNAHFEESGVIKTDLDWIKKGIWVCMAAAISSTGALCVALMVYLLKR